MSERLPVIERREHEPPAETTAERTEIPAAELEALDNELRRDGLKARREAHETAVSGREAAAHGSQDRRPDSSVSQAKRDLAYRQTMAHIQGHLSPASRTFSKIIHQNVVEKTSDVLGSTIARPSSMLAGSICAFATVLVLYLLAKRYGFSLSGFELAAGFAVGWVLGLLADGLRGLRRGR